MSTEIEEMPLFWPEKLDKLEKGKSELVDNRDTVKTAILRNKGRKKFSIRTNKETGEIRVWRIK